MILRPYQRKAIDRTFKAVIRGEPSGLWVLPTGCGKTFAFTELAREFALPTLVLVHRDELIGQTEAHFSRQWPGARRGVIKAERNEWEGKDVVIASVQSLNQKRLDSIPANRFGLVITDEAHHSAAKTWARAIEHFEKGFLLGVTATPDRLDGKGLSQWFGAEPIFNYTLRQAIEDGYLVRIIQNAVATEVDLDEVTVRAGDFAPGELANQVNTEERNVAIVEAFRRYAPDRRAAVFCVDVPHAFNLAFMFTEAGFRAACVTGTTPLDERRDLLKRFAEGKIQVMTNCEILTEGFDDPDIDCILMARPTKSRALYTQCVGRGLRLGKRNKAKKDCLILDVTDNCRRHKLITACSLMGTSRTDADGQDVLDLVEEEEKEEAARQEKIRDHIRGPVRWRLESACPWPGLPTLDGYQETAPWQSGQASEKQIKMIRGFGVEIQATLTKGEASFLIERCLAFDAAYPQPATHKQEWMLRFLGCWEEGLTKKEASRLIGIAKKTQAKEIATEWDLRKGGSA